MGCTSRKYKAGVPSNNRIGTKEKKNGHTVAPFMCIYWHIYQSARRFECNALQALWKSSALKTSLTLVDVPMHAHKESYSDFSSLCSSLSVWEQQFTHTYEESKLAVKSNPFSVRLKVYFFMLTCAACPRIRCFTGVLFPLLIHHQYQPVGAEL